MPDRPTKPRYAKNDTGLTDLQNIARDTEARLNNLEIDRDKVEKALWGHNSTPGMVGRLDKVEEFLGDVKKLLWAILGIVLGIAIGGVWQAIAHAIASAAQN